MAWHSCFLRILNQIVSRGRGEGLGPHEFQPSTLAVQLSALGDGLEETRFRGEAGKRLRTGSCALF